MSMTITVDVGAVRVGYDLLDDAGAVEIQAALDLMLAVIRSARFRVLVAASLQYKQDNPFDVGGLPEPPSVPAAAAASPVPSAASPVLGDSVYEFVALRMSDRGELRGVSSGGKYAKYGMSLGSLQGEYIKRAGLDVSAVSGLMAGSQLPHRAIRMRVDPSGAVFLE